MSGTYEPPKVCEVEAKTADQAFANINRFRLPELKQEKELPIGKHPLQLYSLEEPPMA